MLIVEIKLNVRLEAFTQLRPLLNFAQILIPFTEDGSLQVEQNVDLPDYLPEEEAQDEEPDKAVTRVGNGQDGATWLGTAANFLSRSFYW